MYTIITKKLQAILSSLDHRYDYRNLPKKLKDGMVNLKEKSAIQQSLFII